MNSRKIYLSACTVVLIAGCLEAPLPSVPPTHEYQFALPVGFTIEGGPELQYEIERLVEESPVGTPLTFFLASSQQELGSLIIPDGPPKYRRKIARRELRKVYDRFDPEWAGSPQVVDLLSISRTSRSLRKNHSLPLKLIICGSPLVHDPQTGMGIDDQHVWCDGCLQDEESPFADMAPFSEGTTAYWLLDRPDYGAGPSHRSEIEHFLRFVMESKGAPLVRMSSSAKSLFHSTDTQWDDVPEAVDDCSGLKKVAIYETHYFDQEGKTRRVALQPNLSILVRPPTEALLSGSRERVAFVLDISGSMRFDASENNISSERIVPARNDMCNKLLNMQCSHLMVIGFGGWATGKERLPAHPLNWLGGMVWDEATPENRQSAIQEVQSMPCGGGTPTLPVLRSLLNMKEPPTLIVLFSDGVPTLGGDMIDTIDFASDKLAPAGITLHTVGVGSLSAKSNEFDFTGGVFLTRLARATGGDYFSLTAESLASREE